MVCAGFVLAGGRSSRMGTDKARLVLGGETLVERGLRQLAEVSDEVAIAGGDPELARYGRLIPDSAPGLGPLSGIVAALTQSAYRWNVFVPVDVPFVPASVWTLLLSRAVGDDLVAVLAESGGRTQPLCGVVARSALPALSRSLATGQGKVLDALALAGTVRTIPFANADWFRNANTPGDFAALL